MLHNRRHNESEVVTYYGARDVYRRYFCFSQFFSSVFVIPYKLFLELTKQSANGCEACRSQ